jgi:hypothetical protein
MTLPTSTPTCGSQAPMAGAMKQLAQLPCAVSDKDDQHPGQQRDAATARCLLAL